MYSFSHIFFRIYRIMDKHLAKRNVSPEQAFIFEGRKRRYISTGALRVLVSTQFLKFPKATSEDSNAASTPEQVWPQTQFIFVSFFMWNKGKMSWIYLEANLWPLCRADIITLVPSCSFLLSASLMPRDFWEADGSLPKSRPFFVSFRP